MELATATNAADQVDAPMRSLVISKHAQVRAQQRGVTWESIHVTLRYGDRRRVIGGTIEAHCTKKAVRRMLDGGVVPSVAEHAHGTVLVVDSNETRDFVITVRPKHRHSHTR